jgi:hypothetical protein
MSQRSSLAVAAIAAILVGCTTHVLGDADIASHQADARSACHIYRDLDGGLDRALARGIYVDQVAILARSGVVVDGGPSGCEGK